MSKYTCPWCDGTYEDTLQRGACPPCLNQLTPYMDRDMTPLWRMLALQARRITELQHLVARLEVAVVKGDE